MRSRVRQDRVGANGTVSLRYQSRLRHIGLGAANKHEAVRLLIAGDQVRVIRDDARSCASSRSIRTATTSL